jgi:predicted NAD-dependent protein-ADP-ribosyltransferase YbiA (DUF1768 family)
VLKFSRVFWKSSPRAEYRISKFFTRTSPICLQYVTNLEDVLIKKAGVEQLESTINNPSDYTNHSGGAKGADEAWDIIAKELGFNTNDKHYREPGKDVVDSQKLRELGRKAIPISSELYAKGKQMADTIDKAFGENPNRAYPEYRYRNYAQVYYADAVFAISKGFGTRAGRYAPLDRGTLYAIYGAIIENKPVYVFDQTDKVWRTYNKESKSWNQIDTPALTKNFAGVGTRDINDLGKQAIKDVYEKTFKSQQPETEINIYAGTGENAELSNFAVRPFEDKGEWTGLTFKTVEGAFQAAKMQYVNSSSLFDEAAGLSQKGDLLLDKFQDATGAEAKKLGKTIDGLNVKEWDKNSSKVMKDLLLESFKQNPDALQKLLATGNATLTHKYKGVEQDNGRFSKLLMEVRDELRGTTDTNDYTTGSAFGDVNECLT